jgi:hypothetical protein
MNALEELEKIVEMGKEISQNKGKETFLYYLRSYRSTQFNKEFFELLMLKYGLLKKEYLDVLDLLNKREIIDLLIASILHPN